MLKEMHLMTKFFAKDLNDPDWNQVRQFELDQALNQQAKTPDEVNAQYLQMIAREMRIDDDELEVAKDQAQGKNPSLIQGRFTYDIKHEAVKDVVCYTGLKRDTVLVRDWEQAGNRHKQKIESLMAKRPWETILDDDEDDLEAEHIISEIKNFRNEKFFNVYFN